ncbi:MAG: Nif3-like dinuclear metal center hexameric protein [Deltaproteobacteria bacterium]|nr:MAG: Nif3-like dinuclear metal center hexameric protein [Deltaproteobacteria bacterium]
MFVKDLLNTLDEIAAFGLAEQWDNVGLMLGDPNKSINGVLVALDPTEEVLSEALQIGADCIITHHPLIFHPLKAIYTDQPMGKFLRRALETNISVIGCHTNLDQAVGGVNDVLAKSLGMLDSRPLMPAGNDPDAEASIGFGRVGRLADPLSPEAFIGYLCDFFNLPVLRVAGQLPDEISTVAVCGGSGSDLAETAYASGAQVYITGEVKHSTARWAEAAGFCIIDAGHFATENPVVESLVEVLQNVFAEKDISLPVTQSAKQQNPFVYHQPES